MLTTLAKLSALPVKALPALVFPWTVALPDAALESMLLLIDPLKNKSKVPVELPPLFIVLLEFGPVPLMLEPPLCLPLPEIWLLELGPEAPMA